MLKKSLLTNGWKDLNQINAICYIKVKNAFSPENLRINYKERLTVKIRNWKFVSNDLDHSNIRIILIVIIVFNRVKVRGYKFNGLLSDCYCCCWGKNNKYFDITILIYKNHARLALFIAIQWNRINRNVKIWYWKEFSVFWYFMVIFIYLLPSNDF